MKDSELFFRRFFFVFSFYPALRTFFTYESLLLFPKDPEKNPHLINAGENRFSIHSSGACCSHRSGR